MTAARTRLLRAGRQARHRADRVHQRPARATAQGPKGTVTFLLTDIERSTELLAALGDGYARLLADIRKLVPRRRPAGGRP